MLGTYVSLLLVLSASALVGQALLAACGRREWSWLAPAVGLAALVALAWGGVRLPGEGTAAALVVGAAVLVSALGLRRALPELWRVAAPGLPVLLLGVLFASLPFIAEMRFGILGTSLNPDMTQHLFAADRLAGEGEERLIREGYPLGPHALVVALASLGPSLVHGFGGLTLAISVIACLTPLAVLAPLPAARRTLGALLVGLTYMSASYLIQGSFKETLQALLVLAFALALHQLARPAVATGREPAGAPADDSERGGLPGRAGRARALGLVPLAILAAGSVYAYSFPGLAWLAGALAVWAALELLAAAGAGSLRDLSRRVAAQAGAATVALAAFAAAIGPELPRVSRFAEFETFEPDGPGLGNLFNPISPLEALGIWPSGDFRLDAGAGFAPAIAFWAGAALALTALGFGLWRWLRAGERAVPAALGAAAVLYLYALVAGTPYQEAKAIAIASPLAALIAVRAALEAIPGRAELRRRASAGRRALAALAVAFLAAAAGCSLLALANGPVGPAEWSALPSELRERGELPGATLAVAPDALLDEQHGFDFLAWELRGGEVCVERASELAPDAAEGIASVIEVGEMGEPPLPGLELRLREGGYTVWDVTRPTGTSDCPFVRDGQRAEAGTG